MKALRRVKPGWYLLLALLAYSVLSTLAARGARSEVRDLRTRLVAQAAVLETPVQPSAPEGLWFPIPGARLPQDPAYLPSAARPYRQGVNQGFDLYSGDAGVPIAYGTPVVAADDGVVTRLDEDYEELEPSAWQALLDEVSTAGATDEQLNLLRGRQVWLETDEGLELRYGHLAGIREGLAEGERVYRGQVLGFVGNSGTEDAVNGSGRGARLHFEVWQPDGTFFGEGWSEAEVRARAADLFVGP